MKSFPLLAALLLVGCAAAPQRDTQAILADAARQFQGREFSFVEIPSEGLLSDTVAIAKGGADSARLAREELAALSSAGGGQIVFHSDNPRLARAILESAVAGRQFPGVWLIYAGDAANAAELKGAVERAGMRFGTVSATQ